jgi:hypothetical protein
LLKTPARISIPQAPLVGAEAQIKSVPAKELLIDTFTLPRSERNTPYACDAAITSNASRMPAVMSLPEAVVAHSSRSIGNITVTFFNGSIS